MMKRFTDYTLPAGYTDQDGKTGYFYSFNYGTSHIIVLDTNDANEDGLGAKQLEWLKADLAANNSKYTFVMMHKSMYSSGSHTMDTEIAAMRKQLVPIFYDYGVDVVFAGHDHTYATTYRLGKDGKPTDDLQGVIYMTLGTCGTKFYEFKANDVTTDLQDSRNSIKATLDSQTFAYIKVSKDIINISGYQYVKTDKGLKLISGTGILSGTIEGMVSQRIVSKYGKTNSTVSLKFGKNAHVKYADYIEAPDGYKLKYVSNGQTYTNLSDIKVNGKEKAVVDVYLVNSAGDEAIIDSITLEIGNYAAMLAVCIVVPVVVVLGVGAAITVILIKKKKKA